MRGGMGMEGEENGKEELCLFLKGLDLPLKRTKYFVYL